MRTAHFPFLTSPDYDTVVAPLLAAMTTQFGALAERMSALRAYATADEYISEIDDGMQV